MAEEKTAEPVQKDWRKDAVSILQEAVRQIMAIPFGPVFESKQDQPEYITSHWCKECKRYHRVYES